MTFETRLKHDKLNNIMMSDGKIEVISVNISNFLTKFLKVYILSEILLKNYLYLQKLPRFSHQTSLYCLVYHVSNVFQRSPRRGDISDGDYFKPWKLPYFFFIKHQKYRSYYNTYRYVWLDTHLIHVRNMINWTISVVWWENQDSFCEYKIFLYHRMW